MTHTTTDAAEARALLEAMQKDRSTEHGRAAFRLLRRFSGDYYYDEPTEREDWMLVFLATAEAASGAGEREDALEAAARAMCDRVNGIGDYDENIGQRRTGWLAQAKAGIAAYLASLPPATDPAMVERYQHVKRGTVYEVIGEAKVQDAGDRGVVEGDVVVVYRGDDGQLWAREYSEFHDGRFAALAAAPTIPATGHAATVDPDDLRPWGYAPGEYLIRCRDCLGDLPFEQRPLGAKHSWRCKPHAEAARDASGHAATEGEGA